MLTNDVQFWRNGCGTLRPAREVVRTVDLDVVRIREQAPIKSFVEQHHYSGSVPSMVRCFGLYQRGILVGAAIFSNVARQFRVPFASTREWLALGRLVLLDEVGANAESFFVARCFDALRAEGRVGIVSYSDPEPRIDAAGRRVFIGHIGLIYQALNAVYTGRSKRERKLLLPDGAVYESRAGNKVKSGDQGRAYAHDLLVAHGAEPIRADESPAAWVKRWKERLCRPMRHAGNHRYLWALDRKARKHMPSGLAYPKFTMGRVAA